MVHDRIGDRVQWLNVFDHSVVLRILRMFVIFRTLQSRQCGQDEVRRIMEDEIPFQFGNESKMSGFIDKQCSWWSRCFGQIGSEELVVIFC